MSDSRQPNDQGMDLFTRHEGLTIRRKRVKSISRFEIRPVGGDGTEGGLLAVAEQPGLSLDDDVTFWSHERRQQHVCAMRPCANDRGNALVFEVTDGWDRTIGWFQRALGESLRRTVWTVEDSQGNRFFGGERNAVVAAVRRIKDSGRLNQWYHVDLTTGDGEPALHHERIDTFDDWHVVDLPAFGDGERIDWRLGTALGVALSLS